MRFLIWTGLEESLTEAVSVEVGDGRLEASGTQIGADPVPFRVDYRLRCADRFVTRELGAVATAEGWPAPPTAPSRWRRPLERAAG